jgi:hypothetical protein
LARGRSTTTSSRTTSSGESPSQTAARRTCAAPLRGQRLSRIDHGFDLSIATSGADAGRYPNAPLLVAAHYDPVSGNTIISGHLEAQAKAGLVGENFNLELFASDTASDFPQAQRFLQLGFVDPGDFTVNVPGDLTGQWLTGTISRHRFYTFTDPEGFPEVGSYEETSDLGPPLKVSQ